MNHDDAHHVSFDDDLDRGCWATIGGVTDCGHEPDPDSDVGLCPTHLEELRGDHPRDTTPAPDQPVHVDVVIVDETHHWEPTPGTVIRPDAFGRELARAFADHVNRRLAARQGRRR